MTDRKLRMKVAGRFIDLLGKQMYGGPVPSIAELIANSWDAESESVSITIPEEVSAVGAQIVVKDRGIGMNFDELNAYYLEIGLARRERGERTQNLKRSIMGRKGIGKLAGFGIAEEMTIISTKAGHKVGFTLVHSTLLAMKDLKEFDFLPEIDEATKDPDGVTVVFKKLKLKNNINLASFCQSMARRFALQSNDMAILINNSSLSMELLEFEHRDPGNAGEWEAFDLPGAGQIKYWFGFLTKPVVDKELRGISVFARDRIAQVTPFFFNLTGGINGQVGLEYLTGQVKADFLDDVEDCISTDRQGVNWQFEIASLLEEWGQEKVKTLCKDWKKRRTDEKVEKFKHNYADLSERIQGLPSQERKDLESALERVADLERLDKDDFRTIATSMIAGIARESIKKIIQRINTAEPRSIEDFISVVTEWDIISAVEIAEVTKGKVEVIIKLEEYIEARLPEKAPKGRPDMQTFIKKNIWLLGNEFEHLRQADIFQERGVESWIGECILKVDKGEMPLSGGPEAKRFDLTCMKGPRDIVVIELMRPGIPADYDHAMRLNLYVQRITEAVQRQSIGTGRGPVLVRGILLADDPVGDSAVQKLIQGFHGILSAYDWKGLLQDVKERYRDYYEILKNKAPGDPRLEELGKI